MESIFSQKLRKIALEDTFSFAFKERASYSTVFSICMLSSWSGEIGPVHFPFYYLFSRHIRAWLVIKMENIPCGLTNTLWELSVFQDQLYVVSENSEEPHTSRDSKNWMRNKMLKKLNFKISQYYFPYYFFIAFLSVVTICLFKADYCNYVVLQQMFNNSK